MEHPVQQEVQQGALNELEELGELRELASLRVVVEQVVLGLEVQKEALLQEVEEAACSRHQEEEVAEEVRTKAEVVGEELLLLPQSVPEQRLPHTLPSWPCLERYAPATHPRASCLRVGLLLPLGRDQAALIHPLP